jgi:hypothetical protein
MLASERQREASCAIALPPSGGITPPISGAHEPLMMKRTLSARPLHWLVRPPNGSGLSLLRHQAGAFRRF